MGLHRLAFVYPPYIIATCVLVVAVCFIRIWQTTQRRLKVLGGRGAFVPGPPFGLHIAYGLIKNWFCDELVEYCSDLQRRFGHTIDLEILGMRLVFTDEPRNLEAIMSSKFNDYGKGKDLHRTWKDLMGNSIFATDGNIWRNSQKLLRPHLSKGRGSDFGRTEPHVQELLDKFSMKQIVDVSDLSSRFAFDVVSDIFLEESANTLKSEKFPFGEAMDKLQAYNTIRTCFGWFGSMMPTVFLRGAMVEVEKYLKLQVERIIAMPVYGTSDKEAQNNRLVDSLRSKCGSAKEMRDQLIAVLLAGKDPFGLTLAWALYELARHPEVVGKLKSEIAMTIELGRNPTSQDLHRMPYLKNIVQETLRLYPPLGFNVRVAVEDTSLPVGSGATGQDPVGILKGTQIAYSVASLHHNVDIVGPDANVFKPERWETWKPNKWEYLPFNHGPRVCLGRNFSLLQLRYTLCRLFQEFESVSLAGSGEQKKALRVELNLKPASPILCTFHSRRQ
ncbi:related to n-alkane-inducible cytochrome P450 [Phialocephala subalpina]|uniref:Related to n-alkane-inducible cytochrome P450 n=1 Tax=Phialocephala subalpina TaxID=576137 RepID=A0A1L7WLF6_9HELO|nr:related to n-alkane-inducible cytochrome P450 [Phialocephala subalpina]